MTPTNGQHPFMILPIGTSELAFRTNRFMPTGGVIMAICAARTETTPQESEVRDLAWLPEAAACGLSLLTAVRRTMMNEQDDFRDGPSHVVISRYQAFLENFEAEATLRGRRGFDKRLRKALEANFVGRTDFVVMVSYR